MSCGKVIDDGHGWSEKCGGIKFYTEDTIQLCTECKDKLIKKMVSTFDLQLADEDERKLISQIVKGEV